MNQAVFLLPGGVMPAQVSYAALLEHLGDRVRAIALWIGPSMATARYADPTRWISKTRSGLR